MPCGRAHLVHQRRQARKQNTTVGHYSRIVADSGEQLKNRPL
jgi:hypothetical protein